MKNKIYAILIIGIIALGLGIQGATNFDRLVLGELNFGTDPNTTADITFQNDEYLTNVVDGTLSTDGNFSLGNLFTLGTLDSSARIKGLNTLKADTLNVSGLSNQVRIKGPNNDSVIQINGMTENSIYILSAAYDDSTITLRDGQNIKSSAGDINMDAHTDRIVGICVGGNFIVLTSVSND